MKYILPILIAIATVTAYGADAPPDNGASDFRTLRLALSQARFDNPTIQLKVLKTLAKYQFNTDTPTIDMKDAVLAQFNFTSFVAVANTNTAVYVYDYSLPKARPGEPQSMSESDLQALKDRVDDDPQVIIDVIRQSTSEAWYTANGITNRVQATEQ